MPIALTRAKIRRLLPTLRRLTALAEVAVSERLDRIDGSGARADLDDIDARIQRWFADVRGLGAVPRGLWLVEFPSRAGWFGWRHGDDDVTLFRPYGARPEGRVTLH